MNPLNMLKLTRVLLSLIFSLPITNLIGVSVYAQTSESSEQPAVSSWASAKLLKNGGYYTGPTLNNKAKGKGIEKFTDGREYIGEFEADFPDGYGTEYGSEGDILKQGFWRYGVLITSTPYGADK